MSSSTAAALNRLTRRFYEEAAEEFSETRQAPWRGWSSILGCLRGPSRTLQVLDVGCGNARFGVFLQREIERPISYTGTDLSQTLLDHARESFPDAAELLRHDFHQSPTSSAFRNRKFDLVTLWGVLHHVHGERRRAELLLDLAGMTRDGGLLGLSFWQWKHHHRLARRIEPWPTESCGDPILADLAGIEPEEDDYLLRWGREGRWFRYCHHFSDAEVERLLGFLDCTVVSDTLGEGGLNRYLVLRAPHRATTISAE